MKKKRSKKVVAIEDLKKEIKKLRERIRKLEEEKRDSKQRRGLPQQPTVLKYGLPNTDMVIKYGLPRSKVDPTKKRKEIKKITDEFNRMFIKK